MKPSSFFKLNKSENTFVFPFRFEINILKKLIFPKRNYNFFLIAEAKAIDMLKAEAIDMLKEFKEYFAWDYHEIPSLTPELVELNLPIKPNKKPVK